MLEFGESSSDSIAFNKTKIDWIDLADWNVYALGSNDTSGFICKVDDTGSVVWQRTVSFTSLADLVILGDYIYVTGSANSGLIVKYDKDGTMIWNKTLGSTWSGIVTDGTDLYACGWDGSNVAVLIKFDTDGTIIWAKRNGVLWSWAFGMVASDTHLYVLTSGNPYLLKFDFDGTLVADIALSAHLRNSISGIAWDGTNILIPLTATTGDDSGGVAAFNESLVNQYVTTFNQGSGATHSSASVTAYEGGSVVAGQVVLSGGERSGTVATFDASGDLVSTDELINITTTASVDDEGSLSSVDYDNVNLVIAGSSRNVADTKNTGWLIINNDDRASLSGNPNSPLDFITFTAPSSSGGTDPTFPAASISYGNWSATLTTSSRTSVDTSVSVASATYPEAVTPTPTVSPTNTNTPTPTVTVTPSTP